MKTAVFRVEIPLHGVLVLQEWRDLLPKLCTLKGGRASMFLQNFTGYQLY
jgi:hypothetical protein